MKKRLLVMLLAGVMSLSMLTACGGKKAEETTAEPEAVVEQTEEADAETTAETVDVEAETEATEGNMVSDEVFANLQESYSLMVDTYNAVVELYSSDEIAADAEIESLLNEVKGVMDEMGEITQEEISEEDVDVLLDSILALLDSLEALTEGMEVVEDIAAEGDFTLLDVTSDMIDAAIYVGDEESELVLSLFTAPDGTAMCSMLEYDSASESGDVACGAYTAETAEDEDGIAWSYMTFDDVYTGASMELGFGETDAGECYLLLPSGDVYEAEYLDSEEAINYMGVAVALMSE